MTSDTLNKLARSLPFQPFEIKTHGGDTFLVSSREEFSVEHFHGVCVARSAVRILDSAQGHLLGPQGGSTGGLMTYEELREWVSREPFIPFAIVLKGGTKLRIVGYCRVAMLPTYAYVTPRQDGSGDYVQYADIDRCEPLAARRNGRRRRGRNGR